MDCVEGKAESGKGEEKGMKYTGGNGIDILITYMPYRKKPCLAIQEKGGVWKVASFNDEETAEWFARKFEEWVGEEGMIYEE